MTEKWTIFWRRKNWIVVDSCGVFDACLTNERLQQQHTWGAGQQWEGRKER